MHDICMINLQSIDGHISPKHRCYVTGNPNTPKTYELIEIILIIMGGPLTPHMFIQVLSTQSWLKYNFKPASIVSPYENMSRMIER